MNRYCTQETRDKKNKSAHNHKYTILHKTIDRVLDKFKKDLMRPGAEEKIGTPKDKNSMSAVKRKYHTSIIQADLKNDPKIDINMNNRKYSVREAGVVGPERQTIADCIIDNVSSITENEYDCLQDNGNEFLTGKSPTATKQGPSTDVPIKPVKPNPLFKGNMNNAQWSSISTSQSQNEIKAKQDKNLRSTEINSRNDDDCFGQKHKTFPLVGEQSDTATMNIASHFENKFPQLSRNAIQFDEGGKSVDRFIVRSDGIICPVKRVSAFSVITKQNKDFSRGERVSINKERSVDFRGLDQERNINKVPNEHQGSQQNLQFGELGQQRNVYEFQNEKQGSPQGLKVGGPNNPDNDKTPPLPLGTLALQARAFRKFQYLMAFRFRQYFLREYVRSRQFYAVEGLTRPRISNINGNSNKARGLTGIKLPNRNVHSLALAGRSNELEVVHGKISPNGIARNNDTIFTAIQRDQNHTSGIKEAPKETQTISLQDQGRAFYQDLWRYGFEDNDENKRDVEMDQHGNKIPEANLYCGINPLGYSKPSTANPSFELNSAKFQPPSINRDDSTQQHVYRPIPVKSGVFNRRQEIVEPPTRFEVHKSPSSFKDGIFNNPFEKESSELFYIPQDELCLRAFVSRENRIQVPLNKEQPAFASPRREPPIVSRKDYNSSMVANHHGSQPSSMDITRDVIPRQEDIVPFPWSPNTETGFLNM